MGSVDELKKDLEELNKLKEEATRTRVQNVLSLEIRKVESAISQQQTQVAAPSEQKTRPATQVYTEQIKNYAWDQSDKFMKLYVTLNGVQGLNKENITSEFTNQSVKLVVRGLNNRDKELYIARLCEEITPDGSYHKVKTDCVALMMKKKTEKTWAYVTAAEKKSNETKKPASDEKNEDPNASLMKMMQNMYDSGDDEMKRTIAKAWTESKDKNPGLGGF